MTAEWSRISLTRTQVFSSLCISTLWYIFAFLAHCFEWVNYCDQSSSVVHCASSSTSGVNLGDNCIQNFHLGRYNIGYTVGNLVLRWHVSGVVKPDFRTFIRQHTSPNENLNTVIPILMHFCNFVTKRCNTHNAARHPMKCDIINDIKLFPTVYGRIYCRKFLTLSN